MGFLKKTAVVEPPQEVGVDADPEVDEEDANDDDYSQQQVPDVGTPELKHLFSSKAQVFRDVNSPREFWAGALVSLKDLEDEGAVHSACMGEACGA